MYAFNKFFNGNKFFSGLRCRTAAVLAVPLMLMALALAAAPSPASANHLLGFSCNQNLTISANLGGPFVVPSTPITIILGVGAGPIASGATSSAARPACRRGCDRSQQPANGGGVAGRSAADDARDAG